MMPFSVGVDFESLLEKDVVWYGEERRVRWDTEVLFIHSSAGFGSLLLPAY